jgi:hypothetical protein
MLPAMGGCDQNFDQDFDQDWDQDCTTKSGAKVDDRLASFQRT